MKRLRLRGNMISGIGILLLFAALTLTFYNLWDTDRAEQAADQVAEKVDAYREQLMEEEQQPSLDDLDPNALLPDYVRDPDMPMPEVEIDGQVYIGNLQIPTLGLDLPVISQWSYPSLKIAPNRISGSIYKNNMVIAAHNYRRHFGPVRDLPIGTEVRFVDLKGNVFNYKIEVNEVMKPKEVDRMLVSDYDLTLFTCVFSGRARYAIRCNRVDVPETVENVES